MIEYLNNILIQINTSRKVLTILMTHTESYSRVNVIRVNWVHEMWLVWMCEAL